jgi:hypothetical protein
MYTHRNCPLPSKYGIHYPYALTVLIIRFVDTDTNKQNKRKDRDNREERIAQTYGNTQHVYTQTYGDTHHVYVGNVQTYLHVQKHT